MCNDVLPECLMKNPAERARLATNGRAYVEQHAGKAACARAYQAILREPPATEPRSA